MTTLLALLVGLLVACAVHLMLARNVLRFLFGLALLGNGVNLALFLAGGLTRGAPPLIPEGAEALAGPAANALPQALILTAIVIGFGLFAFALALVWRTWRDLGSLDGDGLGAMDREERP